ncbi:MAG: hypothetical protein U9Q92_04800, partial [archaeon]|nr:hypothetical protein [archaeon]
VKAMIKNGLKRKEIAEIFDMREATICQYLKSKRGMGFRFDADAQKHIEKIAMKVAKSKKKETIVIEICRLCSMLKKQKAFCSLHHDENPSLSECDLHKAICLETPDDEESACAKHNKRRNK